jgi:hypothetical protein
MNEMSDRGLTDGVSSKPILATGVFKWELFALFYARFALGAAFLSAVAARFGIWGENTGPDSFKHFMEYTAEVNSFMPAFTIRSWPGLRPSSRPSLALP